MKQNKYLKKFASRAEYSKYLNNERKDYIGSHLQDEELAEPACYVSVVEEGGSVHYDRIEDKSAFHGLESGIIIEATGAVEARKYTTASKFETLTYEPDEDGLVVIDTDGWFGISLTPMWMSGNRSSIRRFLFANMKGLKVWPFCFTLLDGALQRSGLEFLNGIDFSETTSMNGMFNMAVVGSVIDEVDFSSWKVTNKCTVLTYAVKQLAKKRINLSGWDTSNVTSMMDMFYLNEANLEEINLTGWSFKKVKNLGGFFYMAYVRPETRILPNPSEWDVETVTDLKETFCTFGWEDLDLSGWKTDNVTNMRMTFCSSGIVNLNLLGWKAPKVTNSGGILGDCPKLRSLTGDGDEGEAEHERIYADDFSGALNEVWERRVLEGIKTDIDLHDSTQIGLHSVAVLIVSLRETEKGVLTLPKGKYEDAPGIDDLIAPALEKGWTVAFG